MNTKQTEALKLALEALKELRMLGMNAQWHDSWLAKPDEAITAIREALAEQPAQQQEPVAWMDGYRNIYSLEEKAAGCPEATIALVPMANHKKTSGSPINELQCVCGAVWLGEEMVHLPDKRPPASKPFDTHAAPGQSFDTHSRTPQPSKPLTDEEIMEMYNEPRSDAEMIAFARAIEAKLRGKNA